MRPVRIGMVVLIAGMASCSGDDGWQPDPCQGVTCPSHSSCQNQGGTAVCTCDGGWVMWEETACIPTGCSPECDEVDAGECLDATNFSVCRLVDDCPTMVAGECPSDQHCVNGNCFLNEVPTCDAGTNPSADVAEPVYVRQVTAPQVWTGWWSSPAVVDLDGDGAKEIIGAFYTVVVWDAEGNELSRISHDERVYAPVVVADLENDGIMEIAVGRSGAWVDVYEWRDGGLVDKAGWPQSTCAAGNCPEVRGLAAADIDHDSNIEIVATNTQGNDGPQVYVFNPDGTMFQPAGISWPAWPRYNVLTGDGGDADANGIGHHGFGCYGLNVGIGDINDDDDLEIIVTYDNHHINAFRNDGTSITSDTSYFSQRGGDYDGLPLDWGQFIRYIDPQVEEDHYHLHVGEWPGPSWTYWAQWTHSPPIVLDIDGDGNNEVAGLPNAEINSPYETHFHALMVLDGDYATEGNRSARRTPGWETLPQTGMPIDGAGGVVPAPAAVNIIGDELPEIVAPDADGHLYAWGPDATQLWAYDYAQGLQVGASEAAVVDLNADGQPEIIFGTYGAAEDAGRLIILSSSGQLLHELPLTQSSGSINGLLAAPTVVDVDGDGTLEIVLLTANDQIHIYNVPGSEENCLLWPTGRANYLRNGMGPHAIRP